MFDSGKRVKEIRNTLGLTQDQFGSMIGLKKNSLSQIENGKNSLTQQNIVAICKTWNVDEEWLRTGQGEMFIELNRSDEITRLVNEMLNDKSTDLKQRLVSAILQLSPEQIQTGVDWMKETFGLEETADQDDESDEDYALPPFA